MSKKRNKRYVSPRGVAIWPRLNEPDTKFNPEGEFSARLAFDESAESTQKFVQKMESIRDEAFKEWASENPRKAKSKTSPPKIIPVYRIEEDDEGEPTGRITFNFKMRHKIKARRTGKTYELRPTIFNGAREVLKYPPNIGGGSELKVSFEVFPYFNEKDKEFGLSYRMQAVQLLKLVEFGEGAMADDFDDEEDAEDIQDGEASTKSDFDEDDEDDVDEDEDF